MVAILDGFDCIREPPRLSVRITAVIACDGCGKRVTGKTTTTTTDGLATYWDAKRQSQRAGWIVDGLLRHRLRHLCPECAARPDQVAKRMARRLLAGPRKITALERYLSAHKKLPFTT